MLVHNRDEQVWNIPIQSSAADAGDGLHANGFKGDWALANSILLIRDGIWSMEVCQAIASGDIGRVWEILKVWIFMFTGAGNTNNTQYLLKLYCNLKFEYPEATRVTLFNNWLVNLKGEPGHFHKLDLMQEHFNFWLKELAQHKGKEFSDEWYRNVLAMHVHHFLCLKEEIESSIHLARCRKAHTDVKTNNEVKEVIRICQDRCLHKFVGQRDLGFYSSDHFATGYIKLGYEGKLNDFLTNSSHESHNLDAELLYPTNAADASTYMRTPVHYEEGRLVYPEPTADI